MSLELTLTPTYRGTLTLTAPARTLTLALDSDELPLVLTSALRGLQGESGNATIEFPFAWGDASPRSVTIAAADKLVYGAQIHIDVAFDGDGAQLQLGDAGDAERLMAATQNDPAGPGTYIAAPVHRYGTDTPILLTITPGAGATAGAGLLTLFIEQ